MKKRIGAYLKTLGVKSGEMLDITGIKFEIRSLRRKKEDTLFVIGNMVYKMFLKDKFDKERISSECRKIVDLEKQIKIRENKIQKIHESAKKTVNKYLNKDYMPKDDSNEKQKEDSDDADS